MSVRLKFIFFVRSQALGLLLFKICTFYIRIKYINTYKNILKIHLLLTLISLTVISPDQ